MLLINAFLQMPKRWKYACSIFLVLQLFFIVTCREVMPFYLYGMYSSYYGNEASDSPYYEVYINGEKLDWERLPTLVVVHVKNNILQYSKLKFGEDFLSLKGDMASQFNKFGLAAYLKQAEAKLIPENISEMDFKLWLMNYLQAYWKVKIEDLQVYETMVTIAERKMTAQARILLF